MLLKVVQHHHNASFVQPAVLTSVLGGLVFCNAGGAREELVANLALDQGLELPGVPREHVGVVGPVVVPQA